MALYGRSVYGGSGAGGADVVPPTVTNVVQPASKNAFFECDVYDDDRLASIEFLATLGNNTSVWLVAYADGAFRGQFAARSTRTGTGTPSDPYHFKIAPAGGWPVGTNTVRPRILDGGANTLA